MSRILLATLLLIFSSQLAAQESTPAPPTLAEAQAAYQQSQADYKTAITEIETLRGEYQTATPDRQAEINAALGAKVTAAGKQVTTMVDRALALYKLDPKADPNIAKLLLSIVEHSVVGRVFPNGPAQDGGDSYERALPLIAALLAGGDATPELPVWGLLAAFATNDFDLAQKYLDQAKASGVLEKPPAKEGPAQEAFGLAMGFAAQLEKYQQLWTAEKEIRAAEAKADDLPRVKLSTSKGDIVIELFENEAPTATANFITLVKSGYYDGLTFHRVLPHFMAQGGDPQGTGSGGPGYSIACECYRPDFRKHFRGTLSMAHAGRDTGGSQFFLTFVPTGHLDGRHTAFGRVIEGIEILGELQKLDPEKRGPLQPDKIVKAEVLRDRGHEYKFEKLPER
jgi:cyclophilin family peptidyl-prolyl cis-trans isomerase